MWRLHQLSFLLLPVAALLSQAAGFCPQRCRCDDEQLEADCTGAQLETFPISLHPALKRLHLAHNLIRRVDTSMVSSYKALEYLDMSNNAMLSIQAGSFAEHPRLRELRLSNNELAEIEPGTFRGLERLQELDLGENLLSRLPDGLFQATPLLQKLSLASNGLVFLPPSTLDGAVSLRSLNLANNRLSAVPVEALSRLRRLDTLDLAGNDITRLQPGDLARATPELMDLRLSGNRLSSAPTGAFNGLEALRRLHLADIGLTSLDTEMFVGIDRLELLTLGGNPLSRIGPAPLERLHRLRMISIRACPGLNTIEPGTFARNPALERIDIEENPSLTAIPPELFLRLPLLRQLRLRANALTSLPGDSADWRLLQTDLRANPWQCDCSLKWLVELPASVNVSAGACDGPASLSGRAIRELLLEDLSCGAAAASSLALIAGVASGAVLLVLLVSVGLCYRYRRRLHKMLKVLPWRDRVGLKRKEPYHHGKTYYCHEMYDPIHPSDTKVVPVTEL